MSGLRRGALWLALASVFAIVPSTPALGADCPSPDGAKVPEASASDGNVVFRGHGWGHGLGMSQYGAEGAAKLGCTYKQILTTYYPGTAVSATAMPSAIRVGVIDRTHQSTHSALTFVTIPGTNDVPWTVVGCQVGDCANPPRQPGKSTWRIQARKDGRFAIYHLVSGTWTQLWVGGDKYAILQARHDGTVIDVDPKINGSSVNRRQFRWGNTRFDSVASTGSKTPGEGQMYLVQEVTGGVDSSGNGPYSAMERYLWGLAEVPSSFPQAAQRAQAVAARSYALRKTNSWNSTCRCHLVTTPADQNYTGWARELQSGNDIWRSNVNATAGEVLFYGSVVVNALYSSSHGGHSESVEYVWGNPSPGYIQPVDDSRWEMASSNPSERRSWAVAFTWDELAKRLGFDKVTSISVGAPIGAESRKQGVYVAGMKNGSSVQQYWTGWDVRQRLGLLSPNFLIDVFEDLTDGVQLAGDWDGNGRQDVGWFKDGKISLRIRDGQVHRYRYGTVGDIPIVGDFDGDGKDTISIVRDREWHINNQLRSGAAAKVFIYGRTTQGDIPIVGDWNASGSDGVGIVRGSEWHLRQSPSSGAAQIVFRYGRLYAGDVPVTGDWNGDGSDEVGIVRDVDWHLRFALASGPADRVFRYGNASLGDRPVTGDWNANGKDGVGVVRDGVWYLRKWLTSGPAHYVFEFTG